MSIDSERDHVLLAATKAGAPNGSDASGKSPNEIKQDIVQTREQLGAILEELERQLAPRHLLERGVGMLKDTMSGAGDSLSETLRRHPVPLALLGLSVGWMAVSVTTGRGDRVSDVADDAGRRAGASARQARHKVIARSAVPESKPAPYPTRAAGYAYARQKSVGVMGDAPEVTRDTIRRSSIAWQQARDYVSKAGDTLQSAGPRLSRLIGDRPLAVGAFALLSGTVIAALLPRSEAEERLVGAAGEQIRDSVSSLGREAADRAQQVAASMIDTAKEAVRRALDGAGSAAPQKPVSPR